MGLASLSRHQFVQCPVRASSWSPALPRRLSASLYVRLLGGAPSLQVFEGGGVADAKQEFPKTVAFHLPCAHLHHACDDLRVRQLQPGISPKFLAVPGVVEGHVRIAQSSLPRQRCVQREVGPELRALDVGQRLLEAPGRELQGVPPK